MGKSQQTFGKKEREQKRLKKRQDKLKKKEERKANAQKGADLEDMLAYVDEYGNITDTPPDPTKKKEKIDAKSIVIGVPKKVEEEMPTDLEGKVAFFDDSKGFGFINDLRTQEKYFVHVSGLLEDIAEGDKVTFELERGLKGLNAVQVKKI